MTTSHISANKVEASWAKRVIKPILETRNSSDVWIVYLFSDKKKLKGCNGKKDNSKSKKFPIKKPR